jgi:hypothetical protein
MNTSQKIRTTFQRATVPAALVLTTFALGAPVKWCRVVSDLLDLV